MFDTTVLTPERVLFEGKTQNVFLPGSTGEFEVLQFHKPIISLLKEGAIIIDGKREIPIKSGAVRMAGGRLIAIVEE
jgi:F-type H+-transporting ATPase subunit epsilon